MFSRNEIKILALMSAVHFCLIVDFMVIMPQGPQLMRTLDISAQQFGLLVSSYTFGAGLVSLIASFFLDRFDRKTALLLSFAGFALSNLLCAEVSQYSSFLEARFVAGAFGGIVGALIFSIVSDVINLERRASALGIVMSAFAFASIGGVPLCLLLSHRFGWHAPFVLLAAVAIALTVVLKQGLPSMGEHVQKGHARVSSARDHLLKFKDLVFQKNRGTALLFMACLMLGHFSINPFLFPSVISNAKIDESRLPIVYLVGGTASIFASIFFGKASDRFGKKRVFSIALLASLVSIFLVTHLEPSSIAYVVAVITSFFVLMGGRLTPATTILTSTVLPENRGAFLSLIGMVQQFSAALGSFISGLIVVKAPDGSLAHFECVGWMAIFFSLLSLALSRFIQPIEGT